MKTTIATLVVIICFLSACTKTLDVDLRSAEPQIVIQGTIANTGGNYFIKINQTVDFYAENSYPAVTGATVSVLDSNSNNLDYFTETEPGYYYSHSLVGQIGHTYKLSVTVNGKEYTARSTMPDFVALDELSFVQTKILNQTRNLPQVNFQDPEGMTNYYTFTLLVNNVPYKSFYTIDDRLSDGKYIRQQLYMDSSYIQKNDLVTVVMANVDKNVYNYFNVLKSNGGNSSVTPSNPPSNISNGAYGYFAAASVDTKSIIL